MSETRMHQKIRIEDPRARNGYREISRNVHHITEIQNPVDGIRATGSIILDFRERQVVNRGWFYWELVPETK